MSFSPGPPLVPRYFALVMATGIVSIACHQIGLRGIAWALFRFNQAAYAVLSISMLARLGHVRRVAAELGSHAHGPDYLTMVAGSCVLGLEFTVLARAWMPGFVLWLLALGLWAIMVYAIAAGVIVDANKPERLAAIGGRSLLLVVATQAVAGLGTLLAEDAGHWRDLLLLGSLCWFLLGCFLYLVIVCLVCYRLVYGPVAPGDLTPPSWINMGAVAISTLVGATLSSHAGEWAVLGRLRPALELLALGGWATATWWIPLLVVLWLWRHGWRRYPLRYDATYWTIVFPVGMYSAATHQLGEASGLPWLLPWARAFAYLGLGCWAATLIGWLDAVRRSRRAPRKR